MANALFRGRGRSETISFTSVVTRVFGSKYERDVKRIKPLVVEINRLCEEYQPLSDDELRAKTAEFKRRLAGGEETPDDILPEAFAAVKEACRRLVGRKWTVCGFEVTWNMVPFDVQSIGAVVLHQGKIAEMATGEGKTLVATMPAYLNALAGKGVHIVTVNDYLARRDSEWMGEIFKFLGLTVGAIQNEMDSSERREIYRRDILYGTNNEFGFDYLRDNMAVRAEDLVQREHHYAIVDEVDSVLIDEARTPLIISGPVSHSTHRFDDVKNSVAELVRRQVRLVNNLVSESESGLYGDDGELNYEAGIKLLQAQRGAPKNTKLLKLQKEKGVKKLTQRVENDYMAEKRLQDLDEELYFAIDEKTHNVDLTEKGREALSPNDPSTFVLPDLDEEIAGVDERQDLSPAEKMKRKEELQTVYLERNERIHNIHQLLKAYSLFEKDVDYIIDNGKVIIVDEFTGRLMPGRRYSDGLHQALEAKENVQIERETQTLATITIQNYFRMYDKLAGMTGTAETEASEFWQIYKLDVVVIPTNEPVRRVDYDDIIFRTRREKYNAVIEEISRMNEIGRPVLVGTTSVEASETLSRMLKRVGVKHNVLNAKYHQQEAEIVRNAGQSGAVTIATNMAGRGTDIQLGEGVVHCQRCCIICEEPDCEECPNPEQKDCWDDVPCGLHIIGTERHEARRIDRQLRGRAGRQGDPGSSRFHLSLEDDLMRLFGSERIAGIMDRLGTEEGEVIEHPWITRAIGNAQKKVEGRNFEIRKHLLEYDNVMNQQREVIYSRRNHALKGERLADDIEVMIEEVSEDLVDGHTDPKDYPENWDWSGLRADWFRIFVGELSTPQDAMASLDQKGLYRLLVEEAKKRLGQKAQFLGPELMSDLERYSILRVIDEHWKDHLYEMDQLKGGIGLRAYGQKDPLIEYKHEAFRAFTEMVAILNRDALGIIFKAELQGRPEPVRRVFPERGMTAVHQSTTGLGLSSAQTDQEAARQGSTGAKPKPVRVAEKVGRNDPCPCGSGKKYKKCHGRAA